MSRFDYFAASNELKEQPNPYIEMLSINQALERGYELDLELLGSVDKDQPDVILACEDEEKMGYPNIYSFKAEGYHGELGTRKPYLCGMEWADSARYAGTVLTYIKENIIDEMEIWSVWLGTEDLLGELVTEKTALEDLTEEKLTAFFSESDESRCMVVRK